MTAGRPTKYKQEYAEQVYKLCLLGATDKEIANFFGVQESTINNWKNEQEKFLESIKRGKEKADTDVAESLYKRACGYEHEDTKVFCHDGEVVTYEMIKHYPPDTGACMAWLKNRTRKLKQPWSDRQELEHTGEVSVRHYKLEDVKKMMEDIPSGEPDAIAK